MIFRGQALLTFSPVFWNKKVWLCLSYFLHHMENKEDIFPGIILLKCLIENVGSFRYRKQEHNLFHSRYWYYIFNYLWIWMTSYKRKNWHHSKTISSPISSQKYFKGCPKAECFTWGTWKTWQTRLTWRPWNTSSNTVEAGVTFVT